MDKSYFSPEMKIIFFSLADDVLTLNGSNEQYDNGTGDGTWEEFQEWVKWYWKKPEWQYYP